MDERFALAWIKALHFSTCMWGVAWGRYQGIYLNSRGISPTNSGLVRAAGLAGKVLMTPLWGVLADRHPARVSALLLCSVATCTLMLELYRWRLVTDALPLLSLLKVVRSGLNGVGTLLDIVTLQVLAAYGGGREGYGGQRLWTGVAWGVGSLSVGVAIDRFGLSAIFTWTYACTAAVLALLCRAPAAVSAAGAGAGAPPPARARPRTAGEVVDAFRRHARRPSVGRFLRMAVVYGVVMAIPETIVFLQLEREFGAPRSLTGAVTLVGTLTELPVFYFSQRLIARVGHRRMMGLAHAAMGLRLLLLMGLTRATHRLVMGVQLLHGACFALFWTAAVDYANASAPAELRATAQSAVSTAYYLIGAGCGSVLFGAAYERGGARATYAAGIAIAGANYAAHLYHFEAPARERGASGDEEGGGDAASQPLVRRAASRDS